MGKYGNCGNWLVIDIFGKCKRSKTNMLEVRHAVRYQMMGAFDLLSSNEVFFH